MTEHSAEWNQAIKDIQNAPNDHRRDEIAYEFFKANQNEVFALCNRLGMDKVSTIDVRGHVSGATASLNHIDITSIIVASAMLEKLGVSNPSNSQILANADAFAPNACGCHTTQTKFSSGLGT